MQNKIKYVNDSIIMFLKLIIIILFFIHVTYVIFQTVKSR